MNVWVESDDYYEDDRCDDDDDRVVCGHCGQCGGCSVDVRSVNLIEASRYLCRECRRKILEWI